MSCRAWAYCAAARSGTGAAGAGAAPAAAAPGDPGAATVFAATGVVSTGFGAWLGVEPQPASHASKLALTNRFDQLFTDFHLAVSTWIQLCERSETLLHPLVVDTVARSRRVEFM